MVHNGSSYSSPSRGQKPGKSGQSLRGHARLKSISIMLFVIALAAAIAVATAATAKVAIPASGAPDISYPAGMFDNGKARHFQHKAGDGVTVKYFVMKSSDGVIRAAFDACDVCWREGKGYTQKDDAMICNNCGRRFPSARINEVSGGCNPAPLARKLEGGKVVIKVEHILEGKRYFAFGGGR